MTTGSTSKGATSSGRGALARRVALLAAGGFLLTAAAALAGENAPAPAGTEILTARGVDSVAHPPPTGVRSSYWRVFHATRTPLTRVKPGEGLIEAPKMKAQDAPPSEGWERWDFDDTLWPRTKFFENIHGVGWSYVETSPALALKCVRGKFVVPDPATVRGLRLSLSYRGGIVVYVNGAELARKHLPPGRAGIETLAEEYPPEAFLNVWQRKFDKEKTGGAHFDNLMSEGSGRFDRELRIRKLEVDIPATALRPGTNVLALSIHRAPFFGKSTLLERPNTGISAYDLWSTCGLSALTLTAAAGVEPNVDRPKTARVWNCPNREWGAPDDYGDPAEPLRPIALAGARNAVCLGQVVACVPGPMRGLEATLGELRSKDGPSTPSTSSGQAGSGQGKGVIPASCVDVFYSAPSGWMAKEGGKVLWDTLLAAPLPEIPALTQAGGAAVQPVWVKVRVPADAAPGDYAGELKVRAEGLPPTTVPVRIKVADWKMPDPRDFTTHMGITQSPESVAMWYQKELWSEEHWKLLEPSFQLLGELGNKTVFLPIISRTNLGNQQSLIRYIKDPSTSSGQVGEGWKYDFTVFDRYLDLALKYTKPGEVIIDVFDCESTASPKSRGNQKVMHPGIPVTGLDPKTGKLGDVYVPRLDAPEAAAFWGPVFVEIRKRLEARKVLDAAMPGINNEKVRLNPEIVALFEKELLPGKPWVAFSHPGLYGQEETRGYFCQVYIGNNLSPYDWREPNRKAAWRRAGKQDWFYRGIRYDLSPNDVQTLMERSFYYNLSGLGRIGADFWPLGVPARELKDQFFPTGYAKNTSTIAARYPETDWAQLNLEHSGLTALLAPGPEGAARTVRLELLRQGLQECEARIFISKALLDQTLKARLGDDLAKRCDALLEERVQTFKFGVTFGGGGEIAHLDEKLFAAAAEVAAKLK